MAKAKLTGRERVSRMFSRKDHDRVPRHDTFWEDTIRRWNEEGLSGDQDTVYDFLQSDFRPICWSRPMPFPRMNDLVSEDDVSRIFRDPFGNIVKIRKGSDNTQEFLRFGCVDRDDWDQTYKPMMVTAGLHVDVKAAKEAAAEGLRKGQWTFFSANETFEMVRLLLGEQTALQAMAGEPEFVRDISNLCTDLILRDFDALYDSDIHPDGVWLFGDMAYHTGPMCSPQMYKNLVFPDHVRIVQWAHARKLPVIYHSDGNIESYLGLYVEAGFDCIHPIENVPGVSFRSIAERWGEKLCLFGNVDAAILATNDPVKIEREIAGKMEIGKRTRGYAYHSDHSVPPSVNWETYKLVVRLLDRYGNYS